MYAARWGRMARGGIMTSDWITTAEAAELSGYHVEYIRELIRNGAIAAVKKGNAWWIDRKALLGYVKAAEKAKDRRWGAKSD